MGVSYTEVDHGWAGNQRRVTLEASFDASYTSGGEALGAADAGLDTVESVSTGGVTESGYVARWDDVNGTIQMFEENATAGPLAEVAGASDLSTETLRVTVWGRS